MYKKLTRINITDSELSHPVFSNIGSRAWAALPHVVWRSVGSYWRVVTPGISWNVIDVTRSAVRGYKSQFS